MGLFSKKDKEPCPLCGAEVKGLFKTRIKDKVEICKSCAERISLPEDTLKNADVEFIKKHLEYRDNEALRLAQMIPTHVFDFFGDLKVIYDEGMGLVAIGCRDMNNYNAPSVFEVNELTGYQLYRLKKPVDSDQEPGDTATETGLSLISSLGSNQSDMSSFRLVLTTTNEYWPVIDVKLTFNADHLCYEGYSDNMRGIGNLLKCIVQKRPFILPTGALGAND